MCGSGGRIKYAGKNRGWGLFVCGNFEKFEKKRNGLLTVTLPE